MHAVSTELPIAKCNGYDSIPLSYIGAFCFRSATNYAVRHSFIEKPFSFVQLLLRKLGGFFHYHLRIADQMYVSRPAQKNPPQFGALLGYGVRVYFQSVIEKQVEAIRIIIENSFQ